MLLNQCMPGELMASIEKLVIYLRVGAIDKTMA